MRATVWTEFLAYERSVLRWEAATGAERGKLMDERAQARQRLRDSILAAETRHNDGGDDGKV
jgi:hypothetical protein